MPFLMNNRTTFYLLLSKSKISLCCILCSCFRHYISYFYTRYIHLISVTLAQNDEIGNKFKKAKRNFFCFTECKYAAYLLNQHRQLTNIRNICGAIFTYAVMSTYAEISQIFLIPGFTCMHFEKKIMPLKQ